MSSKEGTFSKEGWQKSQEKFSISFGLNYLSNVEGRIVQIRIVRTDLARKIEAVLGMVFEAISSLCSLFLGCTEQFIQLTVGTKNEVQKRSYNSTDLVHFLRQNFWDCFGAMRYFPWLEI
jgi:hypothetical protein